MEYAQRFSNGENLSEPKATKYCNKEEATKFDSKTGTYSTVSIQQDIDDGYAARLEENNVITNVQYAPDYTLGEEDYTKVKDLDNNQAQVFMRYKTQDDSKAVCTLYGGSIHCFEATNNAYESNVSELQTLFTSGTCRTNEDDGVNYTHCSDGDWDCTTYADGSVSCYASRSSGVNCVAHTDGSANCSSGEK